MDEYACLIQESSICQQINFILNILDISADRISAFSCIYTADSYTRKYQHVIWKYINRLHFCALLHFCRVERLTDQHEETLDDGDGKNMLYKGGATGHISAKRMYG